MASKIELRKGEEIYTLEFSRRIILQMEEDGMLKNPEKEIKEHPLSYMTKFVRYAFKKNHSDMTNDEIDNLVDEIPDLTQFYEAVAELVRNCLESVKNPQSGNLSWGKK